MSRFTKHEQRHAEVATARYNVVMNQDGSNDALIAASNNSVEHGVLLSDAALILCGYPVKSNSKEVARQFLLSKNLTAADINFLKLFNPGFFQSVA